MKDGNMSNKQKNHFVADWNALSQSEKEGKVLNIVNHMTNDSFQTYQHYIAWLHRISRIFDITTTVNTYKTIHVKDDMGRTRWKNIITGTKQHRFKPSKQIMENANG
jgi:hypothetical protein